MSPWHFLPPSGSHDLSEFARVPRAIDVEEPRQGLSWPLLLRILTTLVLDGSEHAAKTGRRQRPYRSEPVGKEAYGARRQGREHESLRLDRAIYCQQSSFPDKRQRSTLSTPGVVKPNRVICRPNGLPNCECDGLDHPGDPVGPVSPLVVKLTTSKPAPYCACQSNS